MVDMAQPFGEWQCTIACVRKHNADTRGVDDEDDSEVGQDGAKPKKLGEAAIADGQLEDCA